MHVYRGTVTWTGNAGEGTRTYRGYGRDHEVSMPGKPVIAASADPAFRGDATRWNPEELLVSALAQCHLLWYLHLATEAGIVVTGYVDRAEGTMDEHPDRSGEFTAVTLRPEVTITDAARAGEAEALHHRAHDLCFIARSVNFPVHVDGRVLAAGPAPAG